MSNESRKRLSRIIPSRCSLSRTKSFFKELSNICRMQENILDNTPFGHFWDCPETKLDVINLVYLIKNWDIETNSFLINQHLLKFSLNDVALILGLKVQGELINLENGLGQSEFFKKEFQGARIKRNDIEKKKLKHACSLYENFDHVRVKKLIVLYVFCTFLFCKKCYSVPSSLVSYIDNINEINKYNWAETIYSFIINELKNFKKSGSCSIGGCAIILNVWFYEHTSSTDVVQKDVYPRLFRWADVKLIRKGKLSKTIKKVAEHMILNELVPVAEEEYLFLMSSSPEHCSTQDVPPHISLGERDELKETIEKSIGKIVTLEAENIILKEEIELLQMEKDVEKKKLMDQIDVLEVENRLLKENISVLHNTLRSQEEVRKEEEVQMCNEALSIEYSGQQNSGETRDLVKETPKIYSRRRGRKRGRGRQIRTPYTHAHVEKKKWSRLLK